MRCLILVTLCLALTIGPAAAQPFPGGAEFEQLKSFFYQQLPGSGSDTKLKAAEMAAAQVGHQCLRTEMQMARFEQLHGK